MVVILWLSGEICSSWELPTPPYLPFSSIDVWNDAFCLSPCWRPSPNSCHLEFLKFYFTHLNHHIHDNRWHLLQTSWALDTLLMHFILAAILWGVIVNSILQMVKLRPKEVKPQIGQPGSGDFKSGILTPDHMFLYLSQLTQCLYIQKWLSSSRDGGKGVLLFLPWGCRNGR